MKKKNFSLTNNKSINLNRKAVYLMTLSNEDSEGSAKRRNLDFSETITQNKGKIRFQSILKKITVSKYSSLEG